MNKTLIKQKYNKWGNFIGQKSRNIFVVYVHSNNLLASKHDSFSYHTYQSTWLYLSLTCESNSVAFRQV